MTICKFVTALLSALLWFHGESVPPADSRVKRSGEAKTVQVTVLVKDMREVKDKPLELKAKAAPGDTLEVRLEEQFGVGRAWELREPDRKQFESLGKPETLENPDLPGYPGVKEITVHRLKVLAEGKLTFAWQKSEKDAKLATVTVKHP